MERPDVAKLIDYARTKGRKGQQTIEILGKNYKFLNSFNTEIGYELLKDLCEMHENLLTKISKLEATDDDRRLYKVVLDLIGKWSDRINSYNEAVKKVQES